MNTGHVSDDEICRLIASVIPKRAAKRGVTPEMSLRGDLGIDSLGLMSIVFVLEEKAGIDAFGRVQEFIRAEFVSDLIKTARQS